MRTVRWNVGLAVLMVLMLFPALPAAAGRAPKPSPVPTLLTEWRRDVWQDPEIRTLAESGGGLTTVISAYKRGGRGRWSPDGTQIGGYQRQLGDGSTYLDRAIMVAAANGTGERVVVTGRDLDAFNMAAGHKSIADHPLMMPFEGATWSPDGSAMVFSGQVRDEGPTAVPEDDVWRRRLFTVAVGGGELAAVTSGEGSFTDTEPHWSWALNTIVFVRSPVTPADPQPELWVVNPDGTGLQQLSSFAGGQPTIGFGTSIAAPVWSPDGRRIAVVGNLDRNNTMPSGDVWVLDVAGAPDGTLTVTSQGVLRGESLASEWHPAWSPDGTRLAYIRMTAANERQNRYQLVLGAVTSGQNSVIADSTKQAILFPDWRRVPQP